ncbi:hypothetical protein PAESOLCIP111_01068 [Paenibacillus solanacearum]|uniref:DoxX family protein n=1 Tax=Paenibacillus solanacearum TaxID=2048548 RepID=A0A916JVQ8_9BACL|nr:DoxX family protein [Paenibacillus solanacearum]CAG7608483.1 hypothetical protein PAESOLCIP111_01068 [Paenibacillus solanacearum]
MTILSIIIQVVLGLVFLMFGFMKFGSKQMVEGFKHFGYPGWFRLFTGLVEVISGILVLIGIWNGAFAVWGSLLIVITMFGAILTHLKMNDTVKQMMMPIFLFVLGLIVLLINF